jgi:Spy/CpxP family protein refolding chaperone
MKRKILFSLIAALVLVTGAALAGEHFKRVMVHGGPGSHMDAFGHGAEFAEKLGLSEEQKESAKQLHEELMAKAHPIMEQHHQQMEEIHSLLDAGNANATEIGQKMIAAHATRKQLEAIHEEGFERFASQLTEEQKAKLEELKKDHSFGHRGMRMRIHH